MRERGVALVTALLVVALATTAAVAMVSRQQLDIRRTGNLLDAEQAHLYLLGMEDWAGQVLRRDAEDNKVDHLNEEWATLLPPIPVEGGQVAGQLHDLQGRFNLNNLVREGKVSEPDLARFRRLLAALQLNWELAEAAVDWIDGDLQESVPSGAEDGAYLGMEPPYRAANRLLTDASELRAVVGFDAETWRTLAPHVTALPQRTAINVNTASAPVLMSLTDGLSEADAQTMIDARGEEGFQSANDFLQLELLAGRAVESEAVTVSSHYFQVISDVAIGRITLHARSTLARADNGAARVLLRTQGY